MNSSGTSNIVPNSIKSMDTSFECLISNTMLALNKNIYDVVHEPSFSSHFTTILEDCGNSVCLILDAITLFLSNQNVEISKLCEHIEHIISLLQLLAKFLKSVSEAETMRCSDLKSFPITTGQILLAVFKHCKESDLLYGSYLVLLQHKLKELFRTCHELQLVYLIILQKYFIFDLTQTEEEDIFLDALNINLKIGEIVESLDLKTMAEQWKAYTLICEKYSSIVIHNIVFENCTGSLSRIILKNIKIALEEHQDQKVVLRSLKVSNFVTKILVKMCQTLKNGAMRNHKHLLDLLINIHINNSAYLLYLKKPQQLVDLFKTNIVSAADSLVSELIDDEGFAHCLLHYNHAKAPKDYLFGYLLLLITIEKSLLKRNSGVSKLWLNMSDSNLISCIFNILSKCHAWFNLGLKFESPLKKLKYVSYGLYEYLLTYTVSLSATLNLKQYQALQHKMLEMILDKECFSALFAVDLWILLARSSEHHLNVDQFTFLCRIYQRLEIKKAFANSPQETNLGKIIEMLFKYLEKEDKLKIYCQFNIAYGNNSSLWTVLKIRNLPYNVQKNAEEIVFKLLKRNLEKLVSFKITTLEEFSALVTCMKLAATCSFINTDTIDEELIKAWLQVCPKNSLVSLRGALCIEKLWYFNYMVALFTLTESMIPVLQRNSDGLLKVLHVTSNIISSDNLELKLASLNLIFKLALYNSPHNAVKTEINTIFQDIFKEMFNEKNCIFKNKFYETIRTYYKCTRIRDIISVIVKNDRSLEEKWNHFMNHGYLNDKKLSHKEQLQITSGFQHTHQCLQRAIAEKKVDSELRIQFSNIDTILNDETYYDQPNSKKPKLDTMKETDFVFNRIEADIEQLEKLKENLTLKVYRDRILNLRQRLGSLVN